MRKFGFVIACVAAVAGSAAGGPMPSAVPPNASRITATVLARNVWPPGSLEKERPPLPEGESYWSVELKIATSEAVAGKAQIAEAGSTLHAFSPATIPEQLVGQKIAATVILTGDTSGVRWMIKDLQPLQ